MLFAALLFVASAANAQTKDDPVIMTVNGQPVLRSEFEYSFNKNNSDGVIDKKNVAEYVDLFINYKLKVEAAKEARMDTMTSFREEFVSYRDQQIRPTFITDADVEAGMNVSSSLLNEDIAGEYVLTVSALCAETL